MPSLARCGLLHAAELLPSHNGLMSNVWAWGRLSDSKARTDSGSLRGQATQFSPLSPHQRRTYDPARCYSSPARRWPRCGAYNTIPFDTHHRTPEPKCKSLGQGQSPQSPRPFEGEIEWKLNLVSSRPGTLGSEGSSPELDL